MHKGFIATGAVLAALAVAAGAFGAHGLRQIVTAETLQTFQTGVQYQVYHAFAAILTGVIFRDFPGKIIVWAGRFFVTGIILFSGSLYTLVALKATSTVGLSGIGMITPFGGLFFITGWLLLFLAVMRKGSADR